MAINPILVPHLEDVENIVSISEMTPDEQYEAHKEYTEIEVSEKSTNEVESQLVDLGDAEKQMNDLGSVQMKNLEIIEGPLPDGQVLEPVDGGLQEPLPEGEKGVDAVINQVAKEQMVVEHVAGLLGCRSDRASTGSQKLYDVLGVKSKSTSVKNVYKESFSSNNSRAKAIELYKSHCEGVMDALSKLGSSMWEGIKKLISKIIEFLKSVLSGSKTIFAYINEFRVLGEDIFRNGGNYTFRSGFENGYKEVSPGSILIGCDTMGFLTSNTIKAMNYCSDIFSLTSSYYKAIKAGNNGEAGKIKESIDKIYNNGDLYTLKFSGVTFEQSNIDMQLIYSEGVGDLTGKPVQALSVNHKFIDVERVGEKMMNIANAFEKRELNEIIDGSKVAMSFLNNLVKDLSDVRNTKSDMEVWNGYREVVMKQVQAIKTIFSLPKYVVDALKILSSMVAKVK